MNGLVGTARRRDREPMRGRTFTVVLDRLYDLPDNIAKDGVARTEFNGALDLNLQYGFAAARRSGFYNHVIQRISLTCPLELDAIDYGAGKTSRVSVEQQGEQVISPHLRFKLRSAWTCGCRACRAHRHLTAYYAVNRLVVFKSFTICLVQ